MHTRQTISYGLKSIDVIEETLLMLEKKFNHEQVLQAHTILIRCARGCSKAIAQMRCMI